MDFVQVVINDYLIPIMRLVWNERSANAEEIIRKCEQVRELCEVRDRCVIQI